MTQTPRPSGDQHRCDREEAILRYVHEIGPHANIIRLRSMWRAAHPTDPAIQALHVAMPQYTHTLRDSLNYLHSHGVRMKTARAKQYAWSLVNALSFLEAHSIMHRDIKPENVLLDSSRFDSVVLADFGSAKSTNDSESTVHNPYMTSRWYRSPEQLLGATDYDEKVDVWSFGCVLAELATSTPLFEGDNQATQLAFILRAVGLTEADITKLSMSGTSVPRTPLRRRPWSRVLTKRVGDRKVRMTFGAAYESLLGHCLVFSPSQRAAASSLSMCAFVLGASSWCPSLETVDECHGPALSPQ